MLPELRKIVTFVEAIRRDGDPHPALWQRLPRGGGGKTCLGFSNVRRPANAQLQIPLMDKHDAGRRLHDLTVQFSAADALGQDELVVALGACNGGRPRHGIGDRCRDIRAMGGSVDNPAGV